MIKIRRFRQSDFETLCRIHDAARLIELELAGLADAFLPMAVAAEREGFFEYKVDVAESDGEVCGFVAYETRELAWLYVDPRFHRKGVGRALAAHALERCDPSVFVEVLAGNDPAISLYQSLGFEIKETQKGVMPGNEAFPVEGVRLRRHRRRTG